MPMMEWCDICLKSGMCYYYDSMMSSEKHPEHDEDHTAPLRSEKDWARIADMIIAAEVEQDEGNPASIKDCCVLQLGMAGTITAGATDCGTCGIVWVRTHYGWKAMP